MRKLLAGAALVLAGIALLSSVGVIGSVPSWDLPAGVLAAALALVL